MKRALVINNFSGGWSTDEQLGIEHSFAYSSHIDFRKKPSQMSVLPETSKESGGVVVDLVQNMVMVDDGTIYAIGDQGYFYKRTTGGVWTVVAKLTDGAYGLSYRKDIDKILITGSTTVSEYSPISNSPSIKVDKYAKSASADTAAYLSGGTARYTLNTVLYENDRQEYQPDIEPVVSIKVMIADKGTGDWTLTLHDPANNVIGSKTITNANLTSGIWNEFTFATPVRQYVKPNARTYHFHLTSTVADGTVACATAGDLNTAGFQVLADRLVDSNNGMHPIETFTQYECVGNERYLSVWEPLSEEPDNSEWERHKLTFPAHLEVCGLGVWNEYLAIACEQKATTNNAQVGYIFFWDGTATTYNYFIKTPEGSPHALHEYKNILYYFAGGSWFAYAGGDPVKIRAMPDTDSEYTDVTDTTIVYPYMSTVRRGVHLFGFPSQTTNQSVQHAVYSYGAIDKNFSSSFGLSYTISTGTLTNNGSNNLRIGMIKNFGDALYISWRDGDVYGVDRVDNSSDPFPAAEWRYLFFDDNLPSKYKQAMYVDVEFDDLPAGATITPKYRTSRSGSWISGETATSGSSTRFQINKEFKEIQLGLDITATTTTPVITSITFFFDDKRSEAFS